jgi:hypothetical protein
VTIHDHDYIARRAPAIAPPAPTPAKRQSLPARAFRSASDGVTPIGGPWLSIRQDPVSGRWQVWCHAAEEYDAPVLEYDSDSRDEAIVEAVEQAISHGGAPVISESGVWIRPRRP